MPSKTSKSPPRARPPWKAARDCSEQDVVRIAQELARELGRGHRVVLDGEMGAGKSTFARALLEALGIGARAEGSPTFAIMHEYESRLGTVAHLDLYRMKSE